MKRLAALVAVAFVAASCGGDDDGAGSDLEGVTVFAAASLTEVFAAIAPNVTFNFAGSDELATQIREGAPADVYAAAGPRYPDELFEEDLIGEPQIFATNRLVLIVPADNPAGIESVEDLLKDGVKLVVGAESVPIGDYTRTVLETMGMTDVLENVVSNEEDVKGVVGKIRSGAADAAFVYVTDATAAGNNVEAIELPEEAQAVVQYPIAVVADSENAEAAQEFVDLVLGEDGQAALATAGFGPP
ncbi:MAG TPA: molybdate ABC transporter substrate-binding protein [Gaiellaceae bacterium]|nr:molybdate ABC transporter substrate-binding protein [Gaiellaceae bacterium]